MHSHWSLYRQGPLSQSAQSVPTSHVGRGEFVEVGVASTVSVGVPSASSVEVVESLVVLGNCGTSLPLYI